MKMIFDLCFVEINVTIYSILHYYLKYKATPVDSILLILVLMNENVLKVRQHYSLVFHVRIIYCNKNNNIIDIYQIDLKFNTTLVRLF